MDAFPIFLTVAGRPVVVFGGGAEAAAKLRLLLKTAAHVIVVAEELEQGEIELGRAEWTRAAPFDFTFPEGTALAYAATGDAALDAAVARRARAFGVTVCAADQPEVSDFSTPAIVDRDPVVVAIGTEGAAPVLAREIKARIEAMLPAALGRVACKARALRAHVARRIAPGAPRRRFWHSLFASALDGEFEQGRGARSFGQAARAALEAFEREKNRGAVAFIGAGPGGADLMTLRAAHVLDRADVVLYDALVAPEILELARREALMLDVGKRAGAHAMPQSEIEALIVRHAKAGRRVARLKGGDPSIFGRLAGEIDAARAAGVPCEVVPGVTAASAAAASALAPLTERGRAQELRLLTAHGEAGEPEGVDWRSAARGTAPLAVYMGRSRARDVQRRLVLGGRSPDTALVLVESAGREDERVVHATLGSLGDSVEAMGGEGPLMMLIGVRSRLASATALDATPETEAA